MNRGERGLGVFVSNRKGTAINRLRFRPHVSDGVAPEAPDVFLHFWLSILGRTQVQIFIVQRVKSSNDRGVWISHIFRILVPFFRLDTFGLGISIEWVVVSRGWSGRDARNYLIRLNECWGKWKGGISFSYFWLWPHLDLYFVFERFKGGDYEYERIVIALG